MFTLSNICFFMAILFLFAGIMLSTKAGRKWQQGIIERRRQADFERGFAWAMTEHYLHGVPAAALRNQVIWCIDRTQFDVGVMDAIAIINQSKRN